MTLLIDETEETEIPCVGNYFRCRVNQYYNDKSQTIISKVSFVRLKRKSCKGECATDNMRPAFDGFEEDMCEDFSIVVLPQEPVDGAIYELIFKPGSTDYETGYLDDWEWVLAEALADVCAGCEDRDE